MKKLIPVLFLLAGLGVGVGAGLFLAPSDAPAQEGKEYASAEKEPKDKKAKDEKPKPKFKTSEKDDKSSDVEYLKLTKQFVIPVVEAERISAMVTMSVSLEAKPGMTDTFYAIEPKLRDRFLQVLFDHANTGGFDGNFTTSENLDTLRKSLLEVAQKDLGKEISNVMILSVNRQDA
ncbi:flagellar basal body-associated FliL family protein [Ruegeria lacuscaerulensis]|uniref:flagellar basal body-associated FliL family protein n=1 Tax=Ruegeria lacuscaerulensis TaxID=55218 RepID=UPI00147EE665|nr:flagellar basal body-associated FliL family protein [Ruegeria lacuscaerulensis]